jgi:signal transduction histidine kinase
MEKCKDNLFLVLNRIAVEDLARVFDRFWRSERSREMRQDGSGISLALTKRLLEAQSGRIEVKSIFSSLPTVS